MALKPTTRRTEASKEARRAYERYRGSSEERGYDWTWRKFSERYRAENPLCQVCLERGIVRPSEQVHHKKKLADYPELKYDLDNLAALCERCHSEITAKGG